ncbi:branched-chain amino acid ABC transporter permease [Roseovarius dicentrarchi]|uniref:branched-chain amino acid ABC transporter permease n=1 Tax=Roseovarius dicentrarchi TaxID=2250573 RepID=UPI000DE9FC25|nr:branched-chain amino acid ABC transporter permease [Roseovarius dicentrarchi]
MLQQFLVVAGLSSATYMLTALGFTLIFGIMRVVNFAHGEFLLIGAYTVFVAQYNLGLDYMIALPLAAVVAGGFGIIAERLVFRRFTGDETGGMIVALALAITIKGAVTIIWGVDSQPIDRPFSGSFQIAGAFIPKDQLFAAVMALVLVAGTYWLLNHTRLGLAMRAVAQAPDVARLQGITPWKTYPAAFAIGCALAGFAGALAAPIYGAEPNMGEAALMKAFIVVVLGGLGSIPGALLAAVLLATIEAGISILFNSSIAALASFLVVIVVLLVRPAGILGRT